MRDEKKILTKGFTFIELLVVVTIIAVLTGAAVVAYSSVTRNSRDARRKSDIGSIRSALELCRTETGSYPAAIYNAGDDIVCGGTTYLANTPNDPKTDGVYPYAFLSATSYTLGCTLESGDDCSYVNP